MIELVPLGDRAFLGRFATEDEAACWAAAVRDRRWPGVVDVVLAYNSAAVHADPDSVDVDALETDLRQLSAHASQRAPGKLVRLPVLYDGEDLNDAAHALGLSVDELVSHHSGPDYRVFAIGFLPGFPYAGYLPERLCGLARRSGPRARVPAGSVAIAGRQTGVYPQESPGGWHLIGRTPLRIVNVAEGHFPIHAGDLIRFDPIDGREFEARRGEPL
jgi:KipI family sensor histidine kinase inhibitor